MCARIIKRVEEDLNALRYDLLLLRDYLGDQASKQRLAQLLDLIYTTPIKINANGKAFIGYIHDGAVLDADTEIAYFFAILPVIVDPGYFDAVGITEQRASYTIRNSIITLKFRDGMNRDNEVSVDFKYFMDHGISTMRRAMALFLSAGAGFVANMNDTTLENDMINETVYQYLLPHYDIGILKNASLEDAMVLVGGLMAIILFLTLTADMDAVKFIHKRFKSSFMKGFMDDYMVYYQEVLNNTI